MAFVSLHGTNTTDKYIRNRVMYPIRRIKMGWYETCTRVAQEDWDDICKKTKKTQPFENQDKVFYTETVTEKRPVRLVKDRMVDNGVGASVPGFYEQKKLFAFYSKYSGKILEFEGREWQDLIYVLKRTLTTV